VKSYIDGHYQEAAKAAEADFKLLPDGFDMGMGAYLLAVKAKLVAQASIDKKDDVLVFLMKLPQPPPGR
jgi:hypothetical protein